MAQISLRPMFRGLGRFLQEHWSALTIAVLTAALLGVGVRQCTIQEFQAAQRPRLEYAFSEISEITQEPEIRNATQKLEELMFIRVSERKKQFPKESYSEALTNVLPINVPVPFSPSGVSVRVRNTGFATATKVRVGIILESQIGDVKTSTNELTTIIKGGQGHEYVTVEIDRIVSNGYADVTAILQGQTGKSEALVVAERQSESLQSGFEIISGGQSISGLVFLGSGTERKQPRTPLDPPIAIALYRPIVISPKVEVTSTEVNGTLNQRVLELSEQIKISGN